MIDVDALHEAEQQALDHLAQMDLALAARPRAIVLICDDLQEILELTRGYQRAGRCVRQTSCCGLACASIASAGDPERLRPSGAIRGNP